MEGLPWPAITAASGGWILTAAYTYAVLSGRLVPRRTLEDEQHETSEWRTESRIKDAQLAEKDKQLGHMKQVGNTVKQLADGLQQEMK